MKKVKKWWWGTKTIRFPFLGKIIVLGTPEVGINPYTKDLWDAGYRVHLEKFIGIKFLVFQK